MADIEQFLPWIALLTPLVSAGLIVLLLGNARRIAAYLSTFACLISLAAGVAIFISPDINPPSYSWIALPGVFEISIGLMVDDLSRLMVVIVGVVGSLVHIYSLGYMATDPGKSRYFGGLSLFMFSMLGIVLADNFFMMFVFWELVGVSSYILIGHWFDKRAPAEAAKKAFVVNRIGDFGFMLGILMLWSAAGTAVFKELLAEEKIAMLQSNPLYLGIAVLLVFCGAIGKSAQAPLHVWLPDAMEGPTPVSALIHAATMVAAGVYMLARAFPLIEAAPLFASQTILWTGLVTSIMAALMATQQDDIKKVLAYSTLSQLGYMVMTVGLQEPVAAMFHLYTHAFFKALLFLGAGAVIHALHHEQDIWKMGGLFRRMPATFATFLLATLALMGVPGLSGYYSKHEILGAAEHAGPVIFWLVAFVALLTCFYMTRLFVTVFLGTSRSSHAEHAGEVEPVMTGPLVLLAIPTVISGFGFIAGLSGYFASEEHHKAAAMVDVASYGAIFLGVLGGALLYFGKEKDPIRLPLLANRLGIDDAYSTFVKYAHNGFANLCGWFDRWIIDAVLVRGSALAAWSGGFVLRLIQVGNLQIYSILFGLGLVGVLFLLILR